MNDSAPDAAADGQRMPMRRFLLLGAFTVSLSLFYWMYQCWKDLGRRRSLPAPPILLTLLGVVWIRPLLEALRDDPLAPEHSPATYDPESLSVMWLLAALVAFATTFATAPWTVFLNYASVAVSIAILRPVHAHVLAVNRAIDPGRPYVGWTLGQRLLVVYGVLLWGRNLFFFARGFGTGFEESFRRATGGA